MILELLATDTAMMGALLSIKKHRLQAVRRKELLLGARGTQPVKSIPILEYQMKRSSKASTSELKVGRMIANLITAHAGWISGVRCSRGKCGPQSPEGSPRPEAEGWNQHARAVPQPKVKQKLW